MDALLGLLSHLPPTRTISPTSSTRSQEEPTRITDGSSSVNNSRLVDSQEKFEITANTPPGDIIEYFERVAKLDNYTSKLDRSQLPETMRHGGAATVYRVATTEHTYLAVKCVSVNGSVCDSKALKRSARELEVWSTLKHKNILRLLGLAQYQGCVAMVSNWMSSGSIVKFVNDRPDENRYILSQQVVEAVSYLHAQEIVHGDIKGDNVLISDDGTPMLTDFGLTVTTDSNLLLSATNAGGGTFRWMAPELLGPEGSRSKEADVYALGMTILEILTGDKPFAEIEFALSVLDVVRNQRQMPRRPECLMPPSQLKDTFWEAMTKCWVHNPDLRAKVTEVEELMVSTLKQEKFQVGSLDEVIDYFERVFKLDNYTSRLQYYQPPTLCRRGGITKVYCVATAAGGYVAVKYTHGYGNSEAIQRSARELEIWSTLNHKNILPLLGLAKYCGGLTSVSRWMNLAIVQFVNDRPDENRYVLSQQVVGAVAYLHAREIVHGDIKGRSVLMSNSGTPMLSGFNLATMPESRLMVSFGYNYGGTPIWMAPELLNKAGRRSKEADVYALGMTILEIITGGLPFAEIPHVYPIIHVAAERKTPQRPACLMPPSHLRDAFWNVMTKCWAYEPAQRPTAAVVADLIKNALDQDANAGAPVSMYT